MGRPFIAYLAAHRLVAFLAIFSLSFAIRFSILIYVPRPEMLQSAEASLIANAIASKGQFADPFAVPTGPTAHLTPFYPVLLAGINQVFGTGYTGRFVRCLLVIGIFSRSEEHTSEL